MRALRVYVLTASVLTLWIDSAHAQRRCSSGPGVAITNASVIDIDSGKEVVDQTVLLCGDRITEVRQTKASDGGAGRVVDGRGKFIIPGLWDMHVHGASDERAAWSYPLYIANGVTGVRDMFGPRDANQFRARLATSESPAPHMYLASPIVDGNPPVWPQSIAVNNPDEARAAVDKAKGNGADFVKIYNRLTRDEYFAIADEAKRQRIPFAGHLPIPITAWEATAAGQRSIEHLTAVPLSVSSKEQELQTQWHSMPGGPYGKTGYPVLLEAYRTYSESHAQRLFADFKKNQTWQVPTLTVLRTEGWLEDPQVARDPRLQYMPPSWQNSAPLKEPRYRNWTAADFARGRELFEYDKKLVGAMFRAGVPMLAGTDAMNLYCFPGFSLHDELALLVDSGVTPLGALQMATKNAAAFMNDTARYGSIVPGKIADLVLLEADPLKDIHNTTKIAEVFVSGKEFDRARLDDLLNWRAHCSWSDSDNNWHCRW